MKDLTEGSIPRHLLAMALPIVFGMLLQTLYFVVDLYFVARLGDAANNAATRPFHRGIELYSFSNQSLINSLMTVW